jgi:hypothetical protein
MPHNPVPEGYYTGVVVPVKGDDGEHKIRWGRAGNENRTRQILVYFEIVEGEHAGTVLPWWGYFTKDSAKRTVESLRFCGFKGEDLSDANNQPLNQKVQLVVEHQERDDKVYARVAWVNQHGRSAIKLKDPMTNDDVMKFSAMMRESVAKIDEFKGEEVTPSNGQSNAAPPSPDMPRNDAWGEANDPPPQEEDDIPF